MDNNFEEHYRHEQRWMLDDPTLRALLESYGASRIKRSKAPTCYFILDGQLCVHTHRGVKVWVTARKKWLSHATHVDKKKQLPVLWHGVDFNVLPLVLEMQKLCIPTDYACDGGELHSAPCAQIHVRGVLAPNAVELVVRFARWAKYDKIRIVEYKTSYSAIWCNIFLLKPSESFSILERELGFYRSKEIVVHDIVHF